MLSRNQSLEVSVESSISDVLVYCICLKLSIWIWFGFVFFFFPLRMFMMLPHTLQGIDQFTPCTVNTRHTRSFNKAC